MKIKLLFLQAAVLAAAMMCALGAAAAEAYLCYMPTNTTMTFYYDNQKSSRPGSPLTTLMITFSLRFSRHGMMTVYLLTSRVWSLTRHLPVLAPREPTIGFVAWRIFIDEVIILLLRRNRQRKRL